MDFEEQKRGLVFAMTNVLRTSRLVDMINVQEASANFALLLQAARPGQPIPLAPFYEYLVGTKQCPEDAVSEALLFFKSREARFNVTFALPPPLASLDETTRNRIVSDFITRGATSGTFVGMGAAEAAKKAQAEHQKEKERGRATAFQPPGRPAAGAAGGVSKGLVALFAGVVLVGMGVYAYVERTAPQQAQDVVVEDLGALPCVSLKANHGWAVCRMKAADWTSRSPDELKKMGEVTRAAAARQGHGKGLHVFTLEDNVLRATYKP